MDKTVSCVSLKKSVEDPKEQGQHKIPREGATVRVGNRSRITWKISERITILNGLERVVNGFLNVENPSGFRVDIYRRILPPGEIALAACR